NVFAAPSAALTGTGVYAIADVAESASPSVVYIEVEYKASAYSRSGSSFFDAFSPWFSQEPESSTGAIAQGSGFIISSDGQIVTNQHVVDNDTQIKEIRVHVLNHKEPYTAKLLAKDYKTDLAVLKIEPDSKLAVATLGDSDKSRVGEWVVAIGNPYGQEFDHTVTQGVLSAKGREITIYDSENNTDRDYTNLMQTDAAINPGNSGGPLLNLQGEVIGINTAVQASGQGIGFAIPINVAKNVVQELISKGKVVRPWLGIEYGSFTEDMADYLGLTSTKGVLVSSVFRDSPASKGGLQPGDVIRKVNGQAVDDADAFAKAIGDMKIGTKLTFILDRSDGRSVRSVTVTVTVGERPDDV
ncbi:MAG: trypsin-like peptidase domain-containing protein, partial [Kiritimatiellia bacterium]